MALYRDPGLLGAVLDAGGLRRGAGDVALALVAGPRSPHLIVTREGAFVTCLSDTMVVKNAEIVPREKLDALARNHALVRQRLRVARELVEAGTGYAALLRRLQEAGPDLSREEVAALASYEPLLRRTLSFAVEEHVGVFLATSRRRQGVTEARFVRLLGRASWTMAHLLVLCGVAGRHGGLTEPSAAKLLCLGAAELFEMPGLLGPFARAVWAVARVGKPALPAAKELWRGDERATVTTGGILLAVLGLAHQGLRGEVQKALEVGAGGSVARRVRHLTGPFLSSLFEPDGPHQAFEEVARPIWKQLGLDLAGVEPGPRELLAAVLCLEAPLAGPPEVLVVMQVLLPALARASAEDLYLPAPLARRLAGRTDHAVRLALAFHDERAREPQAEVPRPRVGRNEPCSCGSGRKWKRCCGAGGSGG